MARTQRKPVRFAVFDDSPRTRHGIIQVVGALPAAEILVQAPVGMAIPLTRAYQPEIVIVSVFQPTDERLTFLAAVHQASPESRLILQVAAQFPLFPEHWKHAARRHGAFGFFTYTDGDAVLVTEVQRARETLDQDRASALPPEPLTPREGEVARLVAQGRSDRQVAELLGIREATVGTFLRAIYGKLGISDRRQLIRGRDVDLGTRRRAG